MKMASSEQLPTEHQLIADYGCLTGEGPLWHPTAKVLYWADIPRGRIFRFDPSTGKHSQFFEGSVIGGFTIQQDGGLLLFMAGGAVGILSERGLDYVVRELPDEIDSRFNDVIADPMGRVFCGTMPTERRSGRLYRLDLDGALTLLLDDIGLPNGMGFTLDRKKMYLTDSTARRIYLFDYDKEPGSIANRRVFIETPEGEGVPDGMTVDADGYVWSARWDGWCLVRYGPDGEEERRIRFPARKVSSVAFGGADMTDMFVTTAGGDKKNWEGPGAGGLFKLNIGVQGVQEFFSRVRL